MNCQLRDLTIGYGASRGATIVAERLNAHFEGGTLTCLMGVNGTGKSTLLRTIAGLQPSLSGRVELESEGKVIDVASLSRHSLACHIGIVLTTRPYVVNLTVRELVAMGRTPYTGLMGHLSEEDCRIVDEALRMTGADSFADKRVNALSDGMLQRTMIAKTLAQQTPVILLDEPTAFLDYIASAEVTRLLLRLAHDEGKTIIMSTHDIRLAEQNADYVFTLLR